MSPVDRARGLEAVRFIKDEHERRTHILEMIHESLLDIQQQQLYVNFDLNATRIERDRYRDQGEGL